MRIAIDAKWYFRGPISGRTILRNLLPQLFDLHPEFHWIIFLDKKDRNQEFPFNQENVTIEYVWAGYNLISNVFILPIKYRRLKPDIIVFQTFPSFYKTLPSITFIHDVLFRDYPQFFTWKERLYFVPLKWLAKKADRVIVTTKFVAHDLIKKNYIQDSKKIDIIPLGVNKDFKPSHQIAKELSNAIKNKYDLPERYLLYVGRLNVRKNIENLLRAIPLLKDETIKLVIVGEADWKTPDLESLLSTEKLTERIIITGRVSDEELSVIYALSYIFCFPSFAEGFGLPPLEAMACGVPVIISNTTSLPEVCGNAGVYIDPTDPTSIAEAIDTLIANENFYLTKKAQGISRAKQFTWENMAQQFLDTILKTKREYDSR